MGAHLARVTVTDGIRPLRERLDGSTAFMRLPSHHVTGDLDGIQRDTNRERTNPTAKADRLIRATPPIASTRLDSEFPYYGGLYVSGN